MGWNAKLNIEYQAKEDKTVIFKNQHYGPLAVQRPFYPEDEVCHTYILHPPGGVVGGDSLEININSGQRTKALITSPGATKFYRSNSEKATQSQYISIKDDAFLEWLPQESILFPGANTKTSTIINLTDKANIIGWDILCLGMPVNKQIFTPGQATNSLSISREDTIIFKEKLRIEDSHDLSGIAGLQDYPVVATFFATGCPKSKLPALRDIKLYEQKSLYAITMTKELLIGRYLGYSTIAARQTFTDIWTIIRPHVNGKKACIPRIWHT